MIDNLERYIQMELNEEMRDLSRYEEMLAKLPAGKLYEEGRGRRTYYKVYREGTKSYIRKEDERLVNELKLRAMLEDMCGIIRSNVEWLKLSAGMLSYDPNRLVGAEEKIYHDLPTEYLEMTGFLSERKWAETLVPPREKYEEEHKILTKSGYVVVSSHEEFIANTYTEMGIPFQYEPKLLVTDQFGTVKEAYPDFHVYVRRERRTKYHEHAGKVSDPTYRSSCMWRMTQYVNGGMFLDDDLIFTFGERDGTYDPAKILGKINLHMV